MIAAKPRPLPNPRVYRPRRKPVTVAIGYIYDEGIVFCADTKVTTTIKTTESKLQYFESDDRLCALIFTMASDDSVFPKSAVTACWEMVQKMDLATASMDAIRNTAQFALGEFYRDHIYTHPDRRPGAVYFEMLVGIWLRNQARLYVLHETVLTRSTAGVSGPARFRRLRRYDALTLL